ncbi:MAG: glycosyltransferase [Candidatus Aenigmarchaeota archaeon]|nr:glycosyltransferase [Candidatus Aenigmarchaeota archaeon]MDW8149390.1 glycosyltransferase [Candidatus Aenigmarchaeota archaeon]
MKKETKHILFHDFLIEKGGGERVISVLSKHFKASIVTWFYNKNLTYSDLVNAKIFYQKNFLNQLLSKISILKLFKTSLFFAKQLKKFANFFNENFDVAIFSGFYTMFFAKFLNIPKIYYIQAEPLTYVLERESYKKNYLTKIYKLIHRLYFKKLEKEGILSMDKIIANSIYTKKVYEEYFGVNVKNVIYPPVETRKFYFKKYGDFFLMVSRLYPHKRVHIVAKTFAKLPDYKLVIVGTGPLSKYIRKLSLKYNNITYLGGVTEEKLIELYATCKAVIYISEKEHFGIIPIEANASGKPAIVSNEGGLPETIIDGKTGIIINPPYEKSLMETILTFDENKFKTFDCIKNSKRFDVYIFIEKFEKVINKIIANAV